MYKFKSILFDLDGVLWDSGAAHARAFQDAFKNEGLSGDFSYSSIAGMRTREAVVNYLASQKIKSSEELINRICKTKQYFAKIYLQEYVQILPELPQILQKLSLKFKLALCSSASSQTIDLFFEKSGTKPFFSVILSGENIVWAKPEPDIYLQAVCLLKSPASQALVVEDSVSGIMSGLKAGMRVLGIGSEAATLAHLDKVIGLLPNIMNLCEWLDTYENG